MRAVDDDDGNLANGTPHGGALFAAFNRHGIACTTDAGATTTFAGCTPPATPTLSDHRRQQLGRALLDGFGSAVYDVFRNETGCNAGFTKIANGTSATSLTDTDVANGLDLLLPGDRLPDAATRPAPRRPRPASSVTPVGACACTPPAALRPA